MAAPEASLLELLLGPTAALALLLVIGFAVYRGDLVPGYIRKSDQERIVALEESNDRMSKALLEGSETMAGLREKLAAESAEKNALAETIGGLRGDLAALRTELARERGAR